MGIYSTNLVSLQGLNGAYNAPAVPADQVVILRDIDVYYNGGGGANLFVTGEAGQTIWYKGWGAITAGAAEQWRGRQVIGPGQSWGVHTDAPCDVTVSGYVLSQ